MEAELGFWIMLAMTAMPVIFIMFQVIVLILCKVFPDFEEWANAHLLEED